MVQEVPVAIKENIPMEEAEAIQNTLVEAGATVNLK
jgi:ribosomal protein L7/L12